MDLQEIPDDYHARLVRILSGEMPMDEVLVLLADDPKFADWYWRQVPVDQP